MVAVLIVTVTVLAVLISFVYAVVHVFRPSLLGEEDDAGHGGRSGRRKWAGKKRERRRHHHRHRRPRESQRGSTRESAKRDSKRTSFFRTDVADDVEDDDGGVRGEEKYASFSDSDDDRSSDETGESSDREGSLVKVLADEFGARLRGAFAGRRGPNNKAPRGGAADETAVMRGLASALRGVGALAAVPVAATGALAAEGPHGFRALRALRKGLQRGGGGDRDSDAENDEGLFAGLARWRGGAGNNAQRKQFVPQDGERFGEAAISVHPCLVSNMRAHEELTTAVAFSPSGQYLATAGGERESEVRLTLRATLVQDEALARTQTISLPVEDWVGALAFSGDSCYLVVGTGVLGQILVYRVYRRFSSKPTLECSFSSQHVGPIRHLYMSMAPGSDAYYIASAASDCDTTLKFWSFGRKAKLLYKHDLGERFTAIDRVSFSASGKLMAVVGREDAAVDGVGGVIFFMVRFANLGRVRKVWTVHRIEEARVPMEDLEGVTDVSFGQRSPTVVVLQGASWKLLRVREGRFVRLAAYNNANRAARPFSSVALSEHHQMVIAGRDGDLCYFQLREGKAPKLAEVIPGAQDSSIRRVYVAPEENQIVSLGANSLSARLWSLPGVV